MLKRHLRVLIALLMLAGLSVSAVFAQEEAEGGDYYVTGTQLDGSTAYAGGLEILQYSEEDYYTLSWQVAEPFYGQGIISGNVLTAGWGSNCTLSAYVTDDDNNMSGVWADVAAGKLNPETATVVELGDTTGTWNITGTFSDGTAYEGTMTVTPNADQTTALVEQQIGDSSYSGLGIVDGDVFSVVLGPDGCGLGAYVIQDNGDLVGRWTAVGQTALGTETATPINIAGSHNLSGTNPDDTTYSGSLEVTANNQVHTFDYTIGDQTFPGVGILRGNVISVGFGGDECSVASYFVYPDGQLVGMWSVVGANTTGTENAVRTDTPTYAEGALIPDVAGTYDVSGTNYNDGSEFTGALTITAQGDVYQFSWEFAGGATDEGVGILLGNTLMVGYGGDSCAVNAYRVDPDKLDGVWAVYGRDTLGTETATR